MGNMWIRVLLGCKKVLGYRNVLDYTGLQMELDGHDFAGPAEYHRRGHSL